MAQAFTPAQNAQNGQIQSCQPPLSNGTRSGFVSAANAQQFAPQRSSVIRTKDNHSICKKLRKQSLCLPPLPLGSRLQVNTTTVNSIHTYFRTQQDGKASDVLDMLATKTLRDACVIVLPSHLLPFLKIHGAIGCPLSTRCSLICGLLPSLDQDSYSDPHSSDHARLV